MEAQVYFDTGLKLICVVGSGIFYLPLDNTTQIIYGFQVRAVGGSVKPSNTMVSTPVTSSFGSVDRCQVLLEKEISIHKACQVLSQHSHLPRVFNLDHFVLP